VSKRSPRVCEEDVSCQAADRCRGIGRHGTFQGQSAELADLKGGRTLFWILVGVVQGRDSNFARHIKGSMKLLEVLFAVVSFLTRSESA
jgi:hypothetical protein